MAQSSYFFDDNKEVHRDYERTPRREDKDIIDGEGESGKKTSIEGQ